jgi:poly(3-hydroxybutyrate) depolymerase
VGPQPGAPTTGCGKANPARGAASLNIRGAQADYLVTLPPNYSPDTPTPVVFAFHGRNQTHIQLQTQDAANIETELGSRAIMVYMKSQGGPGWNFAEEVPPNVEFFDTLYPQVFDSYCVDTSKVYAVGHSSGGYFAIILACRYGDMFRGIGSVAGALQETACTGDRVAGMFIHGATDTVVANSGGRAARDLAISTNACQNTTVPGAVAPCVAYQGCAEGYPVEWCEHTEPTYLVNGMPTNHGWPSFASRAINQFFLSLP